jgi:hypothetical protein
MFAPTAWLVPQDWTADCQPSPDVDVLIFFNRGFEQDKALVQLGAMANPRVHSISGTNLLVAIAAHVELGAPVMRLLEAAPDSVHSTPYFFAGFYGQEAGLRWAKTKSPSLSVRNCAARKVRVDVIGYAIWPHVATDSQRLDALHVRVLINGSPSSALEFTPASRQVRLDVPITCVDGTMTIRFDYDHLIAPSRYTDSADTRQLGIGIVGDPQFE